MYQRENKDKNEKKEDLQKFNLLLCWNLSIV